ncbi:MAG: TlpA disulfide reductase family protein [Bacteroidota bacterium]
MKKAILYLLLFGAYIAHAQTISITINGGTEKSVKITLPVNGYYGLPNTKTYTLNEQSGIQVPNGLKTAGNIAIGYNGKTTRVFVEPGESLHVNITVAGKKQITDADGPNAAGIKLAEKLSHPFYQSGARTYFKKDSTMAGIVTLIKRDIDRETQPFDSLMVLKKITPAFYSGIKRDILCYYASVKAAVILVEYARSTYDVKHPTYKASLNKDMEAAWPEIYKNFPPDEYAAGSPDFYYYAKDYIMWYKTMYLGSKAGTYQAHPYNAENQYDMKYMAFDSYFTGKLKEYLLAMYLYEELLQQDYQPQLVQLYNRFNATYPASAYTTYLTPAVNNINTYLAKARENFKPNQRLLASSTINNFDELMVNFKGKTVFIDMWATWCGPCKAEFEFNPDLKKYLADNKVEMLYISMDKDNADKQWQEMIKYYDLSGNHVRTTDNLRTDLMNRFWDGKGYSIPRYVIVKDGVIVEKDALRPADKQKLYEQIGKYL